MGVFLFFMHYAAESRISGIIHENIKCAVMDE